MINFVIYEDIKENRIQYINVILKIMGNKKEVYQITELDRYNEEARRQVTSSIGKKIYILDIEVPGKSGLDYAREIRDSGDWESQIIVVTTHSDMQLNSFTSRLLMLDFIFKYNNLEAHLKKAILTGFMILSKYKSFTFQQGEETYQIPYNDILYVKKTSEEYYTILELKDRTMELTDGIGKIYDILQNDPRFFRTHRGCIVNLFNIKSVDFNKNRIRFENKRVDLISRDKKKELKEKLCYDQINNKEELIKT